MDKNASPRFMRGNYNKKGVTKMDDMTYAIPLDDQIEEKKYTITLGDGTTINNLRLNGNNFISQTEITPSIFDGNLDMVHINDGEIDEIHQNMTLVQITKMDTEWWFILRGVSKNEIENAKIRADIDFIAMMTDVSL